MSQRWASVGDQPDVPASAVPLGTQTAFWQKVALGQTLPQAPQLAGSEITSEQYIAPAALTHVFCGAGQVVVVPPSAGGGGVAQTPSTQVKPPEQTRPQAPQLDGSFSSTAQYMFVATEGSAHSAASGGQVGAGGIALQTPL